MARMTITLSDDLHRALKETAARRGITLGEIIESSLRAYGVKTEESAAELVARARSRSGLDEAEALDLAVRETRSHRRSRTR